MAALEIERKYIVDQIPENLDIVEVIDIQQGYIFSDKNIELRIRKKNDRFFQTIKKGNGLSRTELEIEITYKQFSQLWPLTEKKRIEKKRFEIYFSEHIIELDVFAGKLDGLIMAEVEFTDKTAAESFKKPGWFGKEVTTDERYKNKNLALAGIPEI